MSTRRITLLACALFMILCVRGVNAQNQAFTYQGRFDENGSPAAGPVDLIVKLYAAQSGVFSIGTQTINGVPLLNGVFTVTLNANGEFTANPFAAGADRWVEITVNGNVLTPRQKLSVAPMAAFSAAPWVLNGTNLSYTNGKVGIGTISPDRPLTLNEASTATGSTRTSQLISFKTDLITQWHLNLVSPNGSPSTNFGLSFSESGISDFRLFLAKGGNIGIGTSDPSGRLEIASTNDALVLRPRAMLTNAVSRIAFKDPDGVTPNTYLNFKDTGYPNLSILSGTLEPARLGVNTSDPTQPLDVRGEIAFGSTGQYSPVASGSNATRMLYAFVSDNGTVQTGSGLTVVRNSTGRYTVTFTTPFAGMPAVVVTPLSGGGVVVGSTNSLGSSSVVVTFNTSGGSATDTFFSIIVVGAR